MSAETYKAQARTKSKKLRASCDGCGASKLKCDRVHPECGRCLAQGIPCVYGESRKMGKRPRVHIPVQLRSRPPSVASTSASTSSRGTTTEGSIDGDNGYGGLAESRLDPSSLQGIFGPANSVSDDMNEMSLDSTINDIYAGMFGPTVSTFPALNPVESDMTEAMDSALATPMPHLQENLSALTVPGIDTSGMGSNGPFLPESMESGLETVETNTNGPVTVHDCQQDALEILASLSPRILGDNNAFRDGSLSGRTQDSADLPVASTPGPTFDHSLRIHREANERLRVLLTCSCTISAHQGLIFASIIHRVLDWYREAAGGSRGSSLGRETAVTSISTGMSICASSPTRVASRSVTGSGIGRTGFEQYNGTLPQNQSALGTAPGTLTIGSFDVDDQRVQTALMMQLLLGEVKRAACLVDLFASRVQVSPNATGGLPQTLGTWLRDEHADIDIMIKSKLRELNK